MQECLRAQLLIQDAITKAAAFNSVQLSCWDTCCVGCGCFMLGELSGSQQGWVVLQTRRADRIALKLARKNALRIRALHGGHTF